LITENGSGAAPWLRTSWYCADQFALGTKMAELAGAASD
jgi:hypothetical protein